MPGWATSPQGTAAEDRDTKQHNDGKIEGFLLGAFDGSSELKEYHQVFVPLMGQHFDARDEFLLSPAR